jgi:hypothetical protein
VAGSANVEVDASAAWVKRAGKPLGKPEGGASLRFSGVHKDQLVNTCDSTATSGEDGEDSGVWSIFFCRAMVGE